MAPRICAVAALLLAVLSVAMLERQRTGVSSEKLMLGGSPVTLWRSEDADGGPLVVVAHGYGGSRQMMQPVSITLIRAGFTVAAFDVRGHGRNTQPMAADITSLDGATAQLVDQTLAVAEAAIDLPGVTGPVSLVGHSMATDIVIRAAERVKDIGAVVAISMYSDAVTPAAPERLLIVSGAQEIRLRQVALDRLQQLDTGAIEGQTVMTGGVARRAVASPWVGHVGVLYSPFTLSEIRDWITAESDPRPFGPLPHIGPWLLALLVSLIGLSWPLSHILGRPIQHKARLRRRGLASLLLPVAPALLAAVSVGWGVGGLAAFASLAAFFAIWGIAQLILLWRAGMRPDRIRPLAVAVLLIWGVCLFAPALDRYGAAFLPTGPRLWVMGLLMIGTVPFCLADAILIARSGWIGMLVARTLPILTLLCAMLLAPALDIAFTVLPVMVLFWIVYGLAAGWVRRRSDPWSAGLALGIILAWSIAASTPLVSA